MDDPKDDEEEEDDDDEEEDGGDGSERGGGGAFGDEPDNLSEPVSALSLLVKDLGARGVGGTGRGVKGEG